MFLRSNFTNRTWSYFAKFVGIHIQGLGLRETILQWWKTVVKPMEKMYFKALSGLIIWESWKRRNGKKHERKEVNVQRMVLNIIRNMRMLLMVRKPKLVFSADWPGILHF